MAVLSADQRDELMAETMRRFPPDLGGFGLVKAELRSLLDALDDFIDAEGADEAAASIPYDISDGWKAWLVAQVTAKRAEV